VGSGPKQSAPIAKTMGAGADRVRVMSAVGRPQLELTQNAPSGAERVYGAGVARSRSIRAVIATCSAGLRRFHHAPTAVLGTTLTQPA
jgi:hypothetical protein